MKPKYIVVLTEEQRQYLEKLTSSGTCPVRQLRRAQILLKAEQHWTNEKISEAFNVSIVTIVAVRRTFVKQGMEAALHRKKPEREYEHNLDGEGEAHLIAIACSQPPEGREHWSLRLLQGRIVQLGYTDSISHETIRQVLKKKKSNPG